MRAFDKHSRVLPNRYGLYLLVGLMVYFLAMRGLGLAHIYWLRSINVIILIGALYGSVIAYKQQASASYYEDFFDFFKISMRTALIGVGLFSVFLALYLDQIDRGFMEQLAQRESFGGMISPVSAAVIIFVEGMSSALITSYALIQVLKTRTVETPVSS